MLDHNTAMPVARGCTCATGAFSRMDLIRVCVSLRLLEEVGNEARFIHSARICPNPAEQGICGGQCDRGLKRNGWACQWQPHHPVPSARTARTQIPPESFRRSICELDKRCTLCWIKLFPEDGGSLLRHRTEALSSPTEGGSCGS
ncbi:hypothetical protein VaNZ11_014137 [Volvox africanus]|uniref:Uncharacterized protein n=1 Tax=Volvox africanus TaxID=51714 RepID=A0ABQ5SJ42_9CHLO|nr:hypothetical protein VaNZ11_014137 [Volvox africanus]